MILETRDLHYHFEGGTPALRGLNLAVAKGRILAILGPNGSGKSTLLLHLNGTLRPRSGQVLIEASPADYSRKGLIAWRRRVGLVLQDPDDQLFAASVAEDVSFGPLNLGLTASETRARVAEALQALNISDLGDRPTHMLSGGQKKRVAIAGAVAMRPEVLLLDEPTAGLDHLAAVHLVALLARLAREGMTLVISTHDVDLAHRLADDIALFREGQVLAQDKAEAILTDPSLLERAHLRPPLLLEIGLKARALGLVPPDAPLPRRRSDLMALMEAWAPQASSSTSQ